MSRQWIRAGIPAPPELRLDNFQILQESENSLSSMRICNSTALSEYP